jgi:hypothetical protein
MSYSTMRSKSSKSTTSAPTSFTRDSCPQGSSSSSLDFQRASK